MNTVVIYKSKYGSTKRYAEWIAEELHCRAIDAKDIKINDLEEYDTIIYGGGLYAEIIGGVTLITKNFERLKDKKLIVYTTGITPIDCRSYYDTYVIEKNFKPYMLDKIKIFNFPGKMIIDELTAVHKAALKSLKKIMMAKKNPTDMERLLVELCDTNGDFCDRAAISDLVEYVYK